MPILDEEGSPDVAGGQGRRMTGATGHQRYRRFNIGLDIIYIMRRLDRIASH
jgi:hypothetical protein